MLTQGLRFNMEEVSERIADIGVRAGFVQAAPDARSTAQATIEAVAALRATVCRITGMAETLTQAGVRREQLPLLVERASEDGSLLYNRVILGPTDIKPEIYMTMKADIAHEFWLGKVNLLAALSRRQIVAKGPIPKALKLLPAIKPAYSLYAEFLAERGRTDLPV